jgi:hypothetical protein
VGKLIAKVEKKIREFYARLKAYIKRLLLASRDCKNKAGPERSRRAMKKFLSG